MREPRLLSAKHPLFFSFIQSYYQTQTATGHYISYCLPQRHGDALVMYDTRFYAVIYTVTSFLHLTDSHGQQYTRRPFEMPSHFSVNQYSNPYSHHPVQPQPAAVGHAGAHGKQNQTTFGNTLALVGNPELNRQLSESGSLHLPVAQQWFAGRAGAADRGKLRRFPSASSRRAMRGFKYWTQETADGAMPGIIIRN